MLAIAPQVFVTGTFMHFYHLGLKMYDWSILSPITYNVYIEIDSRGKLHHSTAIVGKTIEIIAVTTILFLSFRKLIGVH